MLGPSRLIDRHSPVNWSNPLNRGLLGWYYVPSEAFIAGNKVLNLASNKKNRQNTNDGTITSGPATFVRSSRHSFAFRQMSSTHYVALDDGLIPGDSSTAGATWCGWIKAENRWTDFRENTIWSSRNCKVGFYGAQANGGQPYSSMWPKEATASTFGTATKDYGWSFVAGTIFSNGFLKVYYNGELAGQQTYTGNFQTQVGFAAVLWAFSDRQVIQGNWLGPYHYDDTRIYNRELYRDWETDRKSTRLNSSHLKLSRMPSSA